VGLLGFFFFNIFLLLIKEKWLYTYPCTFQFVRILDLLEESFRLRWSNFSVLLGHA
jgi:hypothetical protein